MVDDPGKEVEVKTKIRRSLIYYAVTFIILTLAFLASGINNIVYYSALVVLGGLFLFSFIGYRSMQAEIGNKDQAKKRHGDPATNIETNGLKITPSLDINPEDKGVTRMGNGADYLEIKHKLLCLSIGRAIENEKDIYDATRYAWKLKVENARNVDYIIGHSDGKVRGVFKADHWLPADDPEFEGLSENIDSSRWGFVGSVAPSEVLALYFGKDMPEDFSKKGAANPVRFLSPSSKDENGSKSEKASNGRSFKYYLDAGEGPSTIEWSVDDVDISETTVEVDYLRIEGEEDFVFIKSDEGDLKTLDIQNFEAVPTETDGEYQLYFHATIEVPFDIDEKYPDEMLFSLDRVEVALKFYLGEELLKYAFEPVEEGKIELHNKTLSIEGNEGGQVASDIEAEAVVKNVVLFYPEGFNSEFDGPSGLSEEDLSNFVDGAAYEMSTIISEYMDDSVKSVHIIKWNKDVVGSSIEIMDIGTEDPLVFFQDNDIGEPISLIVEHNDEDWNYSFLKISESANASFWVIGLDEKGDVISNEYESGEYSDGFNVEGDEYKNMDRNVEIFNKI